MKRHPRTLEIAEIIQEQDSEGMFRWGGDGDEGEYLMDLLDQHFETEPEHGKYQALVESAQTFVHRCEIGQIRSRRSFAAFKLGLQALMPPVPFVPVEDADGDTDQRNEG